MNGVTDDDDVVVTHRSFFRALLINATMVRDYAAPELSATEPPSDASMDDITFPFLSKDCSADFSATKSDSNSHNDTFDQSEDHPIQLRRRLGLIDALLLGIAASIGTGIFVVTGETAKTAGPSVCISFVAAGLLACSFALVFADFASDVPVTGGPAFVYINASLGEMPAFFCFCQIMTDYSVGAAAISRSFSSYFFQFIENVSGKSMPSWLIRIDITEGISVNIIAPFLIIVVSLLMSIGVSESTKINGFMTTVKIAIIFTIIVSGSTVVSVNNWQPFIPIDGGIVDMLQAVPICFFSYIGFDTVANVSEELQNPQRNLPIAILLSVIVCIILYVSAVLVLTGMVPFASIDISSPFSSAFEDYPSLNWVVPVVSGGAALGLITTLFAGLYAQSRSYFAISREYGSLLPQGLTKTNRFGVPTYSILVPAIVAIILSTFFDLKLLAPMLSIGVLITYSFICCGLIIRRSQLRFHPLLANQISCPLSLLLVVSSFLIFSGFILNRILPSYIGTPATVCLAVMGIFPISFIFTHYDYVNTNQKKAFLPSVIRLISIVAILFSLYLISTFSYLAYIRVFVIGFTSILYYCWKVFSSRESDGAYKFYFCRNTGSVSTTRGRSACASHRQRTKTMSSTWTWPDWSTISSGIDVS